MFVTENNSHLLLLWLMVEVALPGGTDKVGKVAGTELELKKVVMEMFATGWLEKIANAKTTLYPMEIIVEDDIKSQEKKEIGL